MTDQTLEWVIDEIERFMRIENDVSILHKKDWDKEVIYLRQLLKEKKG